MVLHALPLPRGLHPAVHRRIGQGIPLDIDGILVDIRVEPQRQCLRQAIQPGPLRQLQELLDALRLDDGKLLPDLDIMEHRFLHAELLFHRLEPDPVGRQPVLCIDAEQLDELFLRQILQCLIRIHDIVLHSYYIGFIITPGSQLCTRKRISNKDFCCIILWYNKHGIRNVIEEKRSFPCKFI